MRPINADLLLNMTMKIKFHLTLFLLALWPCIVAAAVPPIVSINNLDTSFDLNPHIEYIEDKNHEYILEDILAGKHNSQWQLNTKKQFVGDNPASKYWFRVSMNWQGKEEKQVVVYVLSQYSNLYELGFVLPGSDGEYDIAKLGYSGSFSAREVKSNLLSGGLFLQPNQTTTLIGWIDNSKTSANVVMPLYITSADTFATLNEKLNVTLIVFYAAMAALLLYNSCLFLTLRQPVYGLYLLFSITAILAAATVDGSSARWLGPDVSAYYFHIGILNGFLLPMAYLAFVTKALDDLTFCPALKSCYLLLMVVGLVGCATTAIAFNLSLLILISAVYCTTIIFTVLVILITALAQRVATTGYLFLAELFLLIGSTGFFLMSNNIMELGGLGYWSLHCGIGGEALSLSLALAGRTRIAQQSANENIERYKNIYCDYKKLFDHSIQGLFTYSLKDKQFTCNTAYARFFGYEDTESFIKNRDPSADIGDYFTGIDQKTLVKRLCEYGGITNIEGVVKSPQLSREMWAREIWASFSFNLVRDEQGTPISVEGSITDITQKKQKEEAEKSKAISEAKSQAKSQFFASMSHELRTPLTSILGYSEAALSDDASLVQKQRSLEIIYRSGQHLLQLVNDTLDLAKIEAQKLEVENIEFCLLDLLKELHDDFSILALKKSIRFDIDYQLPLPTSIMGDPTRLRQILLNICGNAVKFTERGGVTVTVACNSLEETISLAIQDTGIGIKETYIDHVYGAFTQVDASMTRNFGGTGLGLYLSKQLAEKLGGSIRLQSEYGRGSTFTLLLPTGRLQNKSWLQELPAALISTPAIAKMAVKEVKNIQRSNAIRILLAEDNPDIQALIALYVKRNGATVDCVADGGEAIQKAMLDDYDLILMDMEMPHMNGMTAVRYLRSKGYHKKIFALTAHESDVAFAECKVAGCDGILTKPLNAGKFNRLIQSLKPVDIEEKLDFSTHPLACFINQPIDILQ